MNLGKGREFRTQHTHGAFDKSLSYKNLINVREKLKGYFTPLAPKTGAKRILFAIKIS